MIKIEKLLYLDKEFISLKYEEYNGINPDTKITKSESINASARIPLFSGGASAIESKTYSTSTTGMLKDICEKLYSYEQFNSLDFSIGKSSRICWIEGSLGIDTLKKTTHNSSYNFAENKLQQHVKHDSRIISETNYFSIKSTNDKFALVPTDTYWASGISAFKDLINNVIGPLEIPVQALLRIYAAQTSFDQWMSVPLIITERWQNLQYNDTILSNFEDLDIFTYLLLPVSYQNTRNIHVQNNNISNNTYTAIVHIE